MKALILSDLHLEFHDFKINKQILSTVDLVILAGDIHGNNKAYEWISRNITCTPVIYVLGNHEYYYQTHPDHLYSIKEMQKRDALKNKNTHIHILENNHICIDGVNFFGCTLWTDFNLFGDSFWGQFDCEQNMSDFRVIRRHDGLPFKGSDALLAHEESKAWLKDQLIIKQGEVNVVVTHHLPSLLSVPDIYKDNSISPGFASNLDDFICEHEPYLWVHGHTHDQMDYMLGRTRIVCNPRGYPSEHKSKFVEDFIVDIESC